MIDNFLISFISSSFLYALKAQLFQIDGKGTGIIRVCQSLCAKILTNNEPYFYRNTLLQRRESLILGI
jgi:hypothetical protein